jgi:hypothetical protein
MPLIGAVAMGGLGLIQGQQKQKADKNAALANAEVMRYSPWTGMKADMKQVDGGQALMGAAQGALGGAMQGANFSKAAPSAPMTPPPAGGGSAWDSMSKGVPSASPTADNLIASSDAFKPMAPMSQMPQKNPIELAKFENPTFYTQNKNPFSYR